MMRFRVLFGFLGAVTCCIAALIAEGIFYVAHLSENLDDRAARVLIFRSDIARRLELVGGKSGDVRITLAWNNRNDLDLHCTDPTGFEIAFPLDHRHSPTGGSLDVDANAVDGELTRRPVENIYWPFGGAPQGHYRVFVQNFNNHGDPDPTSYTCEVLVKRSTRVFRGEVGPPKSTKMIAEFEVGPGGFSTGHTPSAILRSIFVTCFWTTMLVVSLCVTVAGAQQWVYRIYCLQPLFTKQDFYRVMLWTVGSGVVAGGVGQLLFNVWEAAFPGFPTLIGRILGWTVMGGVFGLGFSSKMPNYPGRQTAVAGLIGGLLGVGIFMGGLIGSIDGIDRVLAASVLGFLIGFMIQLVIAADTAQESDIVTSPSLSIQPMYLRANRTSAAGTLQAIDRHDTNSQK